MKQNHVYIQGLRVCVLVLSLCLPGYVRATTHIVQFGGSAGYVYAPASFTALVGDTVKWEGDFSMHPLSSTIIPANSQSWHVTSGSAFLYTITQPGTYNYQCDFHVGFGMKGSFIADGPVDLHQLTPANSKQGRHMTIGGTGRSEKPFVNFVVYRTGPVVLKIFDLQGREEATVLNRVLQEGNYTVSLDPGMTAGGPYGIRLISNSQVSTGIIYSAH